MAIKPWDDEGGAMRCPVCRHFVYIGRKRCSWCFHRLIP